jgi:hypothetical protein
MSLYIERNKVVLPAEGGPVTTNRRFLMEINPYDAILLCFDTETNGLRANRMIAWGAVLVGIKPDAVVILHKCDCLLAYSWLNSIYNGGKEGLQSEDIHHITDESRKHVDEHPSPVPCQHLGQCCTGVWEGKKLRKHIQLLLSMATHVVGHNICYDLKVLHLSGFLPLMERPPKVWDTMYEYGWGRISLAKQYAAIGFQFDESKHHGAYYDAYCCMHIAISQTPPGYQREATVRIFKKMIDRRTEEKLYTTANIHNTLLNVFKPLGYKMACDEAGQLTCWVYSWNLSLEED